MTMGANATRGPRGLAFAVILLVAASCSAASGRSPESATVTPEAGNAASADIPTNAASATAVARAPAPSDQPATSANDAAVRLSGNGPLAAGSYYLDNRYYTNASRLTLTLPAGWTTEEYGELYKDRGKPGEVKFITWTLTHVFADVCHWGPLVNVGSTVDELVTGLTEQEGREASAPTSVTVGGYPAKRVELTVPADVDPATCTNGVLRYWPAPGPDLSDGDCCASPGSTDSVYVVDVAGNRLVVVARYQPGSSAENLAELQAVVDSIEIEP